jgi:glycine betaine/proline transport system substrate-binding protein
MKRKYTIMGAAFTATVCAAGVAKADCGDVTISEMNWASSAIITAVSEFLMEQGYGCNVTRVPTATVPALTSLTETGEPQIVTEVWPAVATIYNDMVADGTVVTLTNVLPDGGEDGWWIPDYLAEAHPELMTLEGILANPELVGGRFHNCPEGWGCRISNDNLITAFDLAGSGMEVFNHGSGEILAASIASAYTDKEPWFGYYWAPTSVLGKYNMVKVDMGPIDVEKAACNALADCETPGQTGWPAATVVTGVTPAFRNEEPEVAELMSKVQFSNALMGELLAWQEDNNASADEAAVYFLTQHKDVWQSWLNEDAAVKLAAVLQ